MALEWAWPSTQRRNRSRRHRPGCHPEVIPRPLIFIRQDEKRPLTGDSALQTLRRQKASQPEQLYRPAWLLPLELEIRTRSDAGTRWAKPRGRAGSQTALRLPRTTWSASSCGTWMRPSLYSTRSSPAPLRKNLGRYITVNVQKDLLTLQPPKRDNFSSVFYRMQGQC